METFRPAIPPFPPIEEEGYVLLFRDGKVLVRAVSGGLSLCTSWPKGIDRPESGRGHFLGWLADKPCHAFELPASGKGARAQQGPPGYTFRELRSLFGLLLDGEFQAAVTATEVLHFERTFRLCPSCGAELVRVQDRWLKRCTSCSLELEPRTQPTVIGLIYDGPKILLTQPHGLPREMFTLPATPIGPGESMEVALKMFLQTGLGVELSDKGTAFFGSQPWPYPDRLVIGLYAHAKAGELQVETSLFSTARWCHVDELPAMPAPISLARRMADWYAQLPRFHGKPSLPRH